MVPFCYSMLRQQNETIVGYNNKIFISIKKFLNIYFNNNMTHERLTHFMATYHFNITKTKDKLVDIWCNLTYNELFHTAENAYSIIPMCVPFPTVKVIPRPSKSLSVFIIT